MTGRLRSFTLGEKYAVALAAGAGVIPVFLPPQMMADSHPQAVEFYSPSELLSRLSGLFLPGSESNMEPWRYGADAIPDDASWRDPARDSTSLALIAAALEADMPLFCVCRGFQELNVALGGTLHQQVRLTGGLMDHHGEEDRPVEEQYAHAHKVSFAEGGFLHSLSGAAGAMVNTVHEQGVDRLADRLAVEAVAPDGLVEAARVRDAGGFALGVQWHPEWRYWEDPLSVKLFGAFGDAVRRHSAARAAIPPGTD